MGEAFAFIVMAGIDLLAIGLALLVAHQAMVRRSETATKHDHLVADLERWRDMIADGRQADALHEMDRVLT